MLMNQNTTQLKKFFLSIIKPYKWYMVGLFFTGFYWGLNNALSPFILKVIIDKVVTLEGNKDVLLSTLRPYILLYISLWVLIAVDMRFLDWIKLNLRPCVRKDVINQMFAYLTQHSPHYFQNNFAGSLTNKISDMHSGITTILMRLDDCFALGICLVIAIISLFWVHPLFALILLVWASIFILITICFFKPIQTLSTRLATSKTVLTGKVVDSISNISNVRLFARNDYENTLIKKANSEVVQNDRNMQWTLLTMRVYWDLSIVGLIAVNIGSLTYMYVKNIVTVGDFTFIITLSTTILHNLWYIASEMVVFAEELGKCKQALTILAAPLQIVDKANAKPLAVNQGHISFKDVSFHYGEGAQLFNNKNVVIEPGEKVGLVGLSGSGKSTFVNLILRLFEVESGSILIDGHDIRDVTLASLRENIAMIPQDTSLFHRTLLDNIRYGRADANEQEVLEASKQAHCHEFIMQLASGYQSLVGERGIKLSGGQRQRISIARAILKNAPILIMDEATSALDSATERLIQESLKTLMQGRTTIVIAHRLSTLSEMDRILVFDKGQIIEEGSQEQLIKAQGHYARLWQMQAGGFLPDSF